MLSCTHIEQHTQLARALHVHLALVRTSDCDAAQPKQIQPEVLGKTGKLFGEGLSDDACAQETQTSPENPLQETNDVEALEEDVHQGLHCILSAQPFLFRGITSKALVACCSLCKGLPRQSYRLFLRLQTLKMPPLAAQSDLKDHTSYD